LLIKAVSALLPEVYGERVQHDVTVGGVIRLGAPAAAPKQIAEADFTVLAETPEQVKPPTNVLAVAAAPASVDDYERQFGGKRLVEAALFYDADGKLQPPRPDVVIVDDSEIDRAYGEAGIPHRVTSAEYLIAQGYRNPFLLKLASPPPTPEPDFAHEPISKLAATGMHPDPSTPVPVERPEDKDGQLLASMKPPSASTGAEQAGIRRGTYTIIR
jgi:hypothetical protein